MDACVIVSLFNRFLFDDNKTSEQVVNVQQNDSPLNRYIPLTFDSGNADQPVEDGNKRVLMQTRLVPAMTDDSPTVEEDLDLSKEDIR